LFNCLYILFLCGHMWALPFFLPHENVTSKGNQVSFLGHSGPVCGCRKVGIMKLKTTIGHFFYF
jgi:hypothetical protein